VTAERAGTAGPLAFKAYEIEELADVYFFRPLGAVIAYTARRLRLTPTQLTVAGGAIGMAGGALLYDERLGRLAFALLIVHGIVDSADGQLARITGQTSELGRILDGMAGYVTYAAAYVALVAGFVSRGGSLSIVWWAVLSACSNVAQAQMYDYHRTWYASIAIKGVVPAGGTASIDAQWAGRLFRAYDALQQTLIGRHKDVEIALAARSRDGRVSEADRARYRACFYWPVRGWNLLGDNTRFYAIGVLAVLHHLEWFFAFIVLPMNAALAMLWVWQRRADRRFLRSAAWP
jgi:phosphatidylglycerophosphate synthase